MIVAPPPPQPEPSLLSRFGSRSWLLNARDIALALGFVVILAGSAANIALYLDSRDSEASAAAAVQPALPSGETATSIDATVTETETASAAGAVPEAAPAAPATEAAPGTYVVAKGDVLYEIAVRHGTTPQALAELNNLVDPNVIEVGQVLRLPEPAPGS